MSSTRRVIVNFKLPENLSIPEGINVVPGTANVSEEESQDPKLMSALEKWNQASLKSMIDVLNKHKIKETSNEQESSSITESLRR